jgi:hypothetical protein
VNALLQREAQALVIARREGADPPPCEKLRRATFMPARSMDSSVAVDSEAGPRVATIFVLCVGSCSLHSGVESIHRGRECS